MSMQTLAVPTSATLLSSILVHADITALAGAAASLSGSS